MINVRSVVAFVAAAVLCGSLVPPAVAGQQQQGGQQATAQADPVDLEGGGYIDRVLVRVNGEPILMSDLEEQWSYMRPGLQMSEAQLRAQETQIKQALLGGMIEQLLQSQRAEELGIQASPNQVDRALANVMQNFGINDEQQFEQTLAAQGLSVSELREQLAEQIVYQTLVQQEIQRQLFVSEREIQEYYEENRERFTEPQQVMFQQVAFTVGEGQTKEQARQAAEAALAELRGGASLATIADQYPSAQVYGAENAGWLAVEDMIPEIAAVAESQMIGSYSEPVETRFGYTILQVINRREERTLTLEEARPTIEETLYIERQEEAVNEYTQTLFQGSYVEVLAAEYASVLEMLRNDGTADAPGGGR